MTETNSTAIGLIAVTGDRLTTDSRMVARDLKKNHKNVLRAYDNLKCSDKFKRLNYEPVDFIDKNGDLRRSIVMTKDGFTMLVMGFTGEPAMAFKEKYIAAFNAMAEHIASAEKNLWQKMQALIAKEVSSKVKASFGSHLMLNRKREIPPLRDERFELETQIQPSLLLN